MHLDFLPYHFLLVSAGVLEVSDACSGRAVLAVFVILPYPAQDNAAVTGERGEITWRDISYGEQAVCAARGAEPPTCASAA